MRGLQLAALALGAALAACAAPAAAQQPAPQQKAAPQKATPQQQLERQQAQKATPQQQLERQQAAKASYDTYEPSRRRHGRATGCNPQEDMLGAFCIRQCKSGYAAIDDKKASQRQCRSQKPLPPGQQPAAGQQEVSTRPVPKLPPSPKPAKGD